MEKDSNEKVKVQDTIIEENSTSKEIQVELSSSEELTSAETNENVKEEKKHASVIVIICLILSIVLLALNYKRVLNYFKENKEVIPEEKIEIDLESFKNDYAITKNSIDNFDLAFLKLENEKNNMVYSPLSIKYALGMLMGGAEGDSKRQISTLLGKYKFNKYSNNKNIAFANALFVNNIYKDSIKKDYISFFKKYYDADVVFDDFKSADTINKYVSSKSLNQINGVDNKIKEKNYLLLNALAIDMEWENLLQCLLGKEIPELDRPWIQKGKFFIDSERDFSNLELNEYVGCLSYEDYYKLKFNGDTKVQAVEIAALIDNYDIVKEVGKDKIKKFVTAEYKKLLKEDGEGERGCDYWSDTTGKYIYFSGDENDIETYLNDINSYYRKTAISTDFEMYIDNNVKVFKKDFKKYNNKTLQYVAIMPREESLQKYINEVKEEDLTKLINSTKTIESKNFKDGIITEIRGYIPLFNFDYSLNLKDDLRKLGVVNVFDREKSDLSNLTSSKSVIDDTIHKTQIGLTNDGTNKTTYLYPVPFGIEGDCMFSYEIPKKKIEKIDLTFNKPFMFLIIDKETQEVWYAGRVYNPNKYKSYQDELKKLYPEYHTEDDYYDDEEYDNYEDELEDELIEEDE